MSPHFHICERDEGRNPVERTCVENGKICERPGAEQTRRFCNIYYERLFTEKSVRCIRVESTIATIQKLRPAFARPFNADCMPMRALL